MSKKLDLGKVMITPEGAWEPNRGYEFLSFVQHNGCGYLAVLDNHGIEPGTNDQFWMLVAAKGSAPEVTIDADGNLYVEGELLSDAVAQAKALNERISSAEDSRRSDELARVAAEDERQEAEGQRRIAELERRSSESARISGEDSRKRFETQRQSAETARDLAENNRAAHEESRLSSETQRASAESDRVNNENARIANEVTRQDAEAGRVAAESSRAAANVWEAGARYENGSGVKLKGYNNDAGGAAMAVGYNVTASGVYSVAEGFQTFARATASHAEGFGAEVQGNADYAHAEGEATKAFGTSSHVEGVSTITNNWAEHASGMYNISYGLPGDQNMEDVITSPGEHSVFSIGVGIGEWNDGEEHRANAITVMFDGSVYIKGIGGYDGVSLEGALSLQQVINGLTGQNQ